MRRPPSPGQLSSYPVTGGILVLAAAVSFFAWGGRDIAAFQISPTAWRTQPWQLVTTILPHIDPFHLIFNLYWVWVFGTLIEEVWGSLKTFAIILLFAAGSSAAQVIFSGPGVGLSGVGYGLFGMLWALSRGHRSFLWVIDRSTVAFFVGWFFLCVVTTALRVWKVGNVAHGSGAVLGALLGLSLVGPKRRRMLFVALLAAALALIAAAGIFGRPF